MNYKLLLVFLLLISCIEKEPDILDNLPEINLYTAYPLNSSDVDVTGNLFSNELKETVEYGIVWSEKPNPNIENEKSIIGQTKQSTRFTAKITALKSGTLIYIKAFVKNSKNEINYSNEFELTVQSPKNWKRLGDLKIDEGQFTGVATKVDDVHLTFLRLDQNNNWEQFKHYNGLYYDANLTWQKEKYSWPQVSPRQNPLFFTLNLSKNYERPSTFLGGGTIADLKNSNNKTYLKDFYWVYDNQNYLGPIPFNDGPIAHFTLNRVEYLLEENNTDNFWSYFSLEEFIKRKPFPKLRTNYHFLGIATFTKGYMVAQNLNESEVLLYEYDDNSDNWTQKASFPGKGRLDGIVFSLKNKIYYGLGRTTSPIKGLNDIWEFDPAKNTWKYITNYPGAGNIKVVSGDLTDYALLFCGYQVRESGAGSEKYYNANDTWRFTVD